MQSNASRETANCRKLSVPQGTIQKEFVAEDEHCCNFYLWPEETGEQCA